MTDKEKLIALLNEWGVPFSQHVVVDPDSPGQIVGVGREGSDKVSGYSGFFTDFEFDLEGKFQCMGAWE